MGHRAWFDRGRPIGGAPGARLVRAGRGEWRAIAEDFAAAGARLLALWGQGGEAGERTVFAAYDAAHGLLIAALGCGAGDDSSSEYPGLQDLFPFAGRMQRAVRDLVGLRASAMDPRPWLRHGDGGDYPFVRVAGDGVHEIPVGPVHAGIIEPGHFRFSVVGEKVLRLEQRLGYAHKDIERRFREFDALEGHRLAARVSGDSAVAYAWAYCQALEGASKHEIPPRAAWLRALALELERIENHLGDLGALGNDAGFAFGLTQFSRLKEQVLRASETALGQRYLLDAVAPGGMRVDLSRSGAAVLADTVTAVAAESIELRSIYDEHAGLRDRFAGAGTVTPELAARLGLTGLAGRASGQAQDLRIDRPWAPYDRLGPAKCGATGGDVAARVEQRFEELAESCRLVGRILEGLPAGQSLAPLPACEDGFGVGLVEGWRGPVLVALSIGEAGRIRFCHPHDPSWQNWPVLEHAIIGNIVPDFPLINKSFNLSYSGHDL